MKEHKGSPFTITVLPLTRNMKIVGRLHASYHDTNG